MFKSVRVPLEDEFDTRLIPVPVVKASASPMSRSVPVVTAAPVKSSKTPAAKAADALTRSTTDSSFAAEANSLRTADVPVAPLWTDENKRPVVVTAVADEATEIPKPVVSAFAATVMPLPVVVAVETCNAVPRAFTSDAVTFTMTVSSFAADANSERIPVVDVAPVWSTRSNRPEVVIAVADDVITAAIPEVNPFALIRSKPAAVVAEFAVSVKRLPVVTSVPDDVMSIPAPEVKPFAVMENTRPVVAEFATKATTSVPVNIPEFVTVKAVAVVDDEVISPSATTAEPPIVVVAGRVTTALVPNSMFLLVLIPEYLTTGM